MIRVWIAGAVLVGLVVGCGGSSASAPPPAQPAASAPERASAAGAAAPAASPESAPDPRLPVPVASAAGAFQARFPGPPSEASNTVPTPAGPIEAHSVSVEHEGAVFTITYSDYPAELVRQSTPVAMLDGAVKGAVGNVDGVLIGEESIDHDGHPARHIRFRIPDTNYIVSMRAVLAEQRMYQAIVVCEEGSAGQSLVEPFLASLRIDTARP